jgi:hypothetical protein
MTNSEITSQGSVLVSIANTNLARLVVRAAGSQETEADNGNSSRR